MILLAFTLRSHRMTRTAIFSARAIAAFAGSDDMTAAKAGVRGIKTGFPLTRE